MPKPSRGQEFMAQKSKMKRAAKRRREAIAKFEASVEEARKARAAIAKAKDE